VSIDSREGRGRRRLTVRDKSYPRAGKFKTRKKRKEKKRKEKKRKERMGEMPK
jgi:hypothetical protein